MRYEITKEELDKYEKMKREEEFNQYKEEDYLEKMEIDKHKYFGYDKITKYKYKDDVKEAVLKFDAVIEYIDYNQSPEDMIMTYKIIDKRCCEIVYETDNYDDAMTYLSQDYENLVFVKERI